jgi:hypothetical protein
VESDERREEALRRIGITFWEKRGAKEDFTTGLIIAYGINSLATSLAASTYYLRPCCSLSWEFWKRRNECLEMADTFASLAMEGRGIALNYTRTTNQRTDHWPATGDEFKNDPRNPALKTAQKPH